MSLFVLSYYILIVALFLMAGVFLILPLPKSKGIDNYSLSLKLLSVSYGVLGVYCIFKWAYPIDILGLPFLLSSTLQAHLLGMTYTNMVNSSIITKNYVVKKLLPPLVLSLICMVCISLNGYHHIATYDQFFSSLFSIHTPDIFLRTLWFVYYIVLCLNYVITFFREVKQAKKRLEDYSSDTYTDELKNVNLSFYLVKLVILDSLLITLCPNRGLCTIFNFIILILYICIGFSYVKSLKTYLVIQESDWKEQIDSSTVDAKQDNWMRWRQIIIEKGLYLQPGITIVQLAQELNTNRSSLSAVINQQEGKNFNAFVKSLRITKAQELMRNNPQQSLADICEQIGYTDAANFSRQFKEETGLSPVVWRQSNCNKNT